MGKKVLCLYVPVLHQGYVNLFNKYKSEDTMLFVFGKELIDELKHKYLEIRALSPEDSAKAIKALGIFPRVEILTKDKFRFMKDCQIILAQDGMSRRLAKHLADAGISNIRWETAFLRWDESNVFSQEPIEDVRISDDSRDASIMSLAEQQSQKSSDWWRQVGAVIVKDGNMNVAWNQHLPSEHEPYFSGDPRDFIDAGQRSELCSAIHSEQAIIADAARMVLKGSDIYVTTFPCPICAKLLARAGIKRCFFRFGHSSLDGRKVFEAFNVEIVKVP
jgi:dCMP deaminase